MLVLTIDVAFIYHLYTLLAQERFDYCNQSLDDGAGCNEMNLHNFYLNGVL